MMMMMMMMMKKNNGHPKRAIAGSNDQITFQCSQGMKPANSPLSRVGPSKLNIDTLGHNQSPKPLFSMFVNIIASDLTSNVRC